MFLPGAVPADLDARNRFLNYRRDTDVPKHRLRWNWIVDLPFGRGKKFGGNAGGFLDRIIGGWQLAGIGNMQTAATWTCRRATGAAGDGRDLRQEVPHPGLPQRRCYDGYLYWNGYIPANRINSYDAQRASRTA